MYLWRAPHACCERNLCLISMLIADGNRSVTNYMKLIDARVMRACLVQMCRYYNDIKFKEKICPPRAVPSATLSASCPRGGDRSCTVHM